MKCVSDYSKIKRRKFSINKGLRVVNVIALLLISFTMIYPFWEVLVKSLMSDREIIDSTTFFWPKTVQLEGYRIIFTDPMYNFGRAFFNSVFVTVVTTVYQLTITTLTAYALSKKDLPGRPILNFFFIFTMYFGGGLIPYYLVIRELGLLNKIWVLIVPQFISVYNVLVMRSFFQSFPSELVEASKIDGASDFQVFVKMVLPLSKAILATIALFIAVGIWNNWFNSIMPPCGRPRAITWMCPRIAPPGSATAGPAMPRSSATPPVICSASPPSPKNICTICTIGRISGAVFPTSPRRAARMLICGP